MTGKLLGLTALVPILACAANASVAQAPPARNASTAAVAAAASDFTEREVVFRNGAVELSGTLIVPANAAAAPGIVFLHGSGPATRAGARPYAEEFARLGVASLIFDKRGAGGSGGSWTTSSIDDLAGDALAAVDLLAAEPGIDARRIGLWGVSQAGWIAPLAASRSANVAFMILISGGGASPLESEMFSYRNLMDEAGFSADERARATAILESYFGYLATGRERAQLVASLDAIRGTSLEPLADELNQILPSEENRPNWSWVGAYDPVPTIATLRIPVLLMFGDRDRSHPTDLAVARWGEALAAGGNDDVTIMVFPGAGHGIRLADHDGPGRAPFADGYAEAQIGWLWLHVLEPDR